MNDFEPEWDLVMEEQPEEALEPSEDEKQHPRNYEDRKVMDVEGGKSGYAESGVISSSGARECIAVGVLTEEAGVMYHFVADQMSPEDISPALTAIKMDVETFADIEDTTWHAVGGYQGNPEFTAEKGLGLNNSDRAVARRNRLEGYLDNIGTQDYRIDWIDQEGEIKNLYLDVDRGSTAVYTDIDRPASEEEVNKDPDYLR